jgi:hypothetical protein
MIDKLQQLERVKIFDLLHSPELWNSLNINYHPPQVERLWCQLGVYRLYLHFIHPCKEGEALYHPHPWPSAIHVLEGSYETGFGYGEGTEEPEVFGKVFVPNGGMYYDMTHKDGWHYVRPLGGVCSTIMLAGEPWDREQVGKDYDELLPLSEDRKIVMLEYFKNFFRGKMRAQNDRMMRTAVDRGDWVQIDDRMMNEYDRSKYADVINKKGFVIKNDSFDGLCARFDKKRFDDIPYSILRKLPKQENNGEQKEN